MREAADAGIRPAARRLAALAAALLVALVALAVVAPARAWAWDPTFTAPITVGTDTNVTCTFEILTLPDGTTPGTVQVGDGNDAAIDRSASGALAIPDMVRYGGESYAVTKLGDACFIRCEGLTSTGLAGNSTVTTLGSYCFFECTSLTSTGLATNSTVTSLGDTCFFECTGLTDTGLGSTTSAVTSLGNSCFGSCTGLRDTGLGKNSAVTTLGDACFFECTGLKDTGLGTNSAVTSLGDNCFTDCTSLETTGLGTNSKVATLGAYCFEGCTSLVNAALGSGLKSAPDDPFIGCTALATVYFAGPSSSARGIALPHDVDCYHLASDATWAGVKATDVSGNCKSLRALSQLSVTGGTPSGSPTNPWSSEVKDEILWAEGEAVDVTASTTGYAFSRWASSDAGGSFAAATAASTTYTFGPSAGSGTTTLAGATPVSYTVRFDKNSADATGAMADEGMTYDAEKALTANAFLRAGYTFAGWNTEADGSGTAYADKATVSNLTAADGGTFTLHAQWSPARVQTRTFAIDGVEVTATLTGSGESIDGLVVEKRSSASDAVAGALGGRTLQGDWDVHFTDGTTEGFGTLTLTFPATGGTVQVWEVHSGALAKGADQAVSGGTASATVTTLSEFAVTSAPDAAVVPATAPATTPSTGDGSGTALPALLLAAAGAALAALGARGGRRTGSRR
jgi:uncharacterized repeat protein (TIGR02543 family)